MLSVTDFEDAVLNEIKGLKERLLEPDPQKRLSVESAYAIIQTILTIRPKLDVDFQTFMNKLKAATFNDFESFGLNENIEKIERSYINQKVSEIDLDRYEVPQPKLSDLKEELKGFLFSEKQETKTFILLGSSGSGKSTILQMQYLEALKNWEEGKPILLFINLSLDTDLKSRWESLCSQLGYLSKDSIFNFNIFAIFEHPVMLFLDSFDEAAIKINFVSEFHEALKGNSRNKILICCRSEFIQTEEDFQRFFTRKHIETNESVKRFIVSLNRTGFDLNEKLISEYYMNWTVSEKKPDAKLIMEKIKQEGIFGMLTTGYMVHLTLTVLPELLEELELVPDEKRIFKRITKIGIYEKYITRILRKIESQTENFISKEYVKKMMNRLIIFG